MIPRVGKITFWLVAIAITLSVALIQQWLAGVSTDCPISMVVSANPVESVPVERRLTVRLEPAPTPPEKPAAKTANQPVRSSGASKVDSKGLYFSTSLDYRSQLGFSTYVDVIKRLGGRFFLYDRGRHRIVAELSMLGDQFLPLSDLTGLSARSRVIAGEVLTDQLEVQGVQEFGPGSYQVVFLWPTSLEDHFQSQIEKQLSRSKINPSELVELQGFYRPVAGSVRMVFTQAVLSGGRTTPVEIAVEV